VFAVRDSIHTTEQATYPLILIPSSNCQLPENLYCIHYFHYVIFVSYCSLYVNMFKNI
jgi:hypothetical protein